AIELRKRLLTREIAEILAVALGREWTDARHVHVHLRLHVALEPLGLELHDLAAVRHLAKQLVPESLELADRRQRARARAPPEELDAVLTFRRGAVLHREHRLLQRGGRVAGDLAGDAEELA